MFPYKKQSVSSVKNRVFPYKKQSVPHKKQSVSPQETKCFSVSFQSDELLENLGCPIDEGEEPSPFNKLKSAYCQVSGVRLSGIKKTAGGIQLPPA